MSATTTIEDRRQAAWAAFRLGAVIDEDAFGVVIDIGELNIRATRAWENANNHGVDDEYYKREDAKSERYADQARALATENGWKLDMSGGLWWRLEIDAKTSLYPNILAR